MAHWLSWDNLSRFWFARATDGILSHRGYSCNTAGLILPIIEYAHNTSGGEAIIGGFVRG